MGIAWTVSDEVLYATLQAWLGSLLSNSWYVLDIYVNDYTPAPGDDAGDYVTPTTAQWPGYEGVQLLAPDWSQVSVVDHTAQTNQPDAAVFTFPPGVSALTIYGYRVVDGYGNLKWAESFDSPIEVSYPGGVTIQPYLNLSIAPDPSMSDARSVEDIEDDSSEQSD